MFPFSNPDKSVRTRSKFSHPPTFNVDNQVIFFSFVGKNAIFSNIDEGGWGIRNIAQGSQLLFAGIVAPVCLFQDPRQVTHALTEWPLCTRQRRETFRRDHSCLL